MSPNQRLGRMYGPDVTKLSRRERAQLEAFAGMNPVAKSMVRTMIEDYEYKIGKIIEQLENQDELKHRLGVLQSTLIVFLMHHGDEFTIQPGEIGTIPPGSVVGVDALGKGSPDTVALRVYWRRPGGPPATTELRQ